MGSDRILVMWQTRGVCCGYLISWKWSVNRVLHAIGEEKGVVRMIGLAEASERLVVGRVGREVDAAG